MSVWGAAKRGFGKALRAHRIKHGKRGKTITGVKPLSGNVPWWVGAGGKNPGKRAKIVKTHLSNVRSDKVEKAEKAVKEGKKKLKDLVETGQAEKVGERYFRK
jgi:hypothetical protein